ncbi:MAG: glycosyltransferase family 4 protein [Candidatus Eremiobacteraeota bacterium]|nr:glycosyltransferase family 4 protein [Candidatus Eremiobacteraeota bacterium]
MRVAIDAQLAVGTSTGIGEYVRGLALALRRLGVEVDELAKPELNPWRFDRRVLWDQVLLPARAARSGAELLHCASGTMPLYSPLPVVVTVHDVAWLKAQGHTRAYARYYFGRFALAHYRRAARIVVDSEFSRSELLQVCDIPKDRINVVYPGVAEDFCALTRKPDNTQMILIVGTVERRKNLEVLVRALPMLPGARIVSIGPPTSYQTECEQLSYELGVADRIDFRGYVSRDELLNAYATCAVVAVPSRYEGFGYALAQALCVGAPVIASDTSSLPEVAQGAAPLVGVDDLPGWINALRAILESDDHANPAIRARSVERFAWQASASTMLQAYRCALS